MSFLTNGRYWWNKPGSPWMKPYWLVWRFFNGPGWPYRMLWRLRWRRWAPPKTPAEPLRWWHRKPPMLWEPPKAPKPPHAPDEVRAECGWPLPNGDRPIKTKTVPCAKHVEGLLDGTIKPSLDPRDFIKRIDNHPMRNGRPYTILSAWQHGASERENEVNMTSMEDDLKTWGVNYAPVTRHEPGRDPWPAFAVQNDYTVEDLLNMKVSGEQAAWLLSGNFPAPKNRVI
jgi:hypothetical protein